MKNRFHRYRKLLLIGLVIILGVILLPKLKPEQKWEYPPAVMNKSDNYFDYQSGLECSGYSSAYILRFFGQEADGKRLYENFPGKIPQGATPDGIVTFFRTQGYSIEFKKNASIEELKHDISLGVPVISFIRVNMEEPYTHYVPIIGYDEDYFYFAESLPYMANCQDENLPYNRKTPIEEYKNLCRNVDGMYQCPYFVISKQ